MFSAEDAKEIFQLLQSETDKNGLLVLYSSEDGLVTRKHLYKAFESRVTTGAERVAVSSLARDFDVDAETIRTLVEDHDSSLVLWSGNERDIITKVQRDAIEQKLEADVLHGVVSKNDFLREHDLSQNSLHKLLGTLKTNVLEVDGYLYSKAYSTNMSAAIETILRDHLKKQQAVSLKSTNVPGSPPVWFIHQALDKLLESPDLNGKFHIQARPEGIDCTPVQLVEQVHDDAIDGLRSGRTAYLDIHSFQHEHQAIHSSVQEAQTRLESTQDVETVGTFAISATWISNFSKDRLQDLSRDNCVDIEDTIKQNFPESIRAHVINKVEQSMRALLPGIHRVGHSLLTESGYSHERNTLLGLAKADAASQWQQSKENPKTEVKYSLPSITSLIPSDRSVLQDLAKDRSVGRALEDSFSNEISELEKQNESVFAEYWTDRVASRAAIYTEGLSAVEEPKLQQQLSELLAQYIQKDLVPDAIAKAASQGFSLSRKTRKNVQKLESALGTGTLDIPAITASLDKFSKKQSIDAPTDTALQTSKTTMLNDMARRMQKQKKSDGPLLFLTLVVFLFAKHNSGVVYATGKFAPKLLKQLKTVLDSEQYAKLEAWKEAAKTGTLSADDRDAMKTIVEARV